MPYPFTGSDARTYPQYRDLATDRPLTASPGGSYDMAPVGLYDLPVPPADGNWGPDTAAPPPPPPPPAAGPPPAATTAPSGAAASVKTTPTSTDAS